MPKCLSEKNANNEKILNLSDYKQKHYSWLNPHCIEILKLTPLRVNLTEWDGYINVYRYAGGLLNKAIYLVAICGCAVLATQYATGDWGTAMGVFFATALIGFLLSLGKHLLFLNFNKRYRCLRYYLKEYFGIDGVDVRIRYTEPHLVLNRLIDTKPPHSESGKLGITEIQASEAGNKYSLNKMKKLHEKHITPKAFDNKEDSGLEKTLFINNEYTVLAASLKNQGIVDLEDDLELIKFFYLPKIENAESYHKLKIIENGLAAIGCLILGGLVISTDNGVGFNEMNWFWSSLVGNIFLAYTAMFLLNTNSPKVDINEVREKEWLKLRLNPQDFC